jgi:hypothetical protein
MTGNFYLHLKLWHVEIFQYVYIGKPCIYNVFRPRTMWKAGLRGHINVIIFYPNWSMGTCLHCMALQCTLAVLCGFPVLLSLCGLLEIITCPMGQRTTTSHSISPNNNVHFITKQLLSGTSRGPINREPKLWTTAQLAQLSENFLNRLAIALPTSLHVYYMQLYFGVAWYRLLLVQPLSMPRQLSSYHAEMIYSEIRSQPVWHWVSEGKTNIHQLKRCIT